jgi:hypothetical protein
MECRMVMAMKMYLVLCNKSTAIRDKGMVVLQNCLDSQRDVPGSHSEAFHSSSHDGDQAVNVKVEEFSDVKYGEDPLPMTVVEVKFEPEVSCMSVCPLLGISHCVQDCLVLFSSP